MIHSPFFADWDAFSAHLDSLGLFRMNPGLERVVAGLNALGLMDAPGLAKPPMGMVHIIGTNGKGSTAAFLEAMALAHGHKVGVFTSPHCVTPLERIRIQGKMLGSKEWVRLANAVYAACPGIDFSYFELLTLMAACAFVEHRVEFAVMEAGLGGRWDATSALAYDLTLITPVGMDHEEVLGSTLEAIARDKAGAIQGGEVVCAPQEKGIARIFQQQANDKGAVFHALPDDVGGDFPNNGAENHLDTAFVCPDGERLPLEDMTLGLSGAFQKENAQLALAGWSICTRVKGWSFSPLKCTQGLSRATHPGRMQVFPGEPAFLLDGAHNLMGLAALAASLEEMQFVPDCMIFSCMKDKNLLEDVSLIQSLCAGPILVPDIPDNPRAMKARQLAKKLGSRAVACSNMQAALESISPSCKRVLICGSLFLLGEFPPFRDHLTPKTQPSS